VEVYLRAGRGGAAYDTGFASGQAANTRKLLFFSKFAVSLLQVRFLERAGHFVEFSVAPVRLRGILI
jgi:hypothetical protein